MKVKNLIIAVFAFGLFALSSCKKLYDYVEHHPTATSDACKITQFIVSENGLTVIFDVTYDKKGNMTSVVAREGYPVYMNFDQYYRYDKHNQLTDQIVAYHGYSVPITWHSYQYAHNKIFDSVYFNSGNLSDPKPPVNAPPSAKVFYNFTTDNDGRIISVTSTGNYNNSFQYDAKGNLVRTFPATYDNKINPYRTNEVWQQVFWDYSANNPIAYLAPPNYSLAKIVSYNSYGLPTKYVAYDGFQYNTSKFGFAFDTLEIKYACDISKVNY
ncbi:hypothetical protein [Pinibacter aurantiacus]|uniref:Uncharacterized protein n=1 Tax=Pinibacter aurantiacus TaxID=2851599 RepID=A0A9E2SDM6_9BACT|nr:hypothetical protein [Pinibacter aurantiacus]MBV4359497.1 hypothetical protein [Pinibacter aurantiacus]